MTHHPGRFEFQEHLAGRWITFASDDRIQFVLAEAESMSQFEGRRFRVWDSKDNEVVWPKEK